MESGLARNSRASLLERLASPLRRYGGVVLGFVLFVLAALAIRALLHDVDIHAVFSALAAIPRETLGLALVATLASYASLVGYDWSALRYIGRSAPPGVLVLGSFAAYGLGNTVGLAVLSGGAVRHRFYRGLGLETKDIAIVSTYCAVAFGTGVVLTGLAALVYHPGALGGVLAVPPASVRLVCAAALAAVVIALAWASAGARTLGVGRYRARVPSPAELLAQLAFSVLDILFAGLTLYLLLPAGIELPFSTFIAVFAAAAVASVLSHVPGGIGVFDGIIIGAIAADAGEVPGVAAAVLAYRAIYYLLPFLAALAILSASGPLLRHSDAARRSSRAMALLSLLESMKPALMLGLAALVFVSGAALLLNGVLPIPPDLIEEIAPLAGSGSFELSSVTSGVIGAMLVILANGLRRRVRGAFWIVLALMLLGAGMLAYGRVDADLALFLAFAALLLWISRAEFYRSSKLTTNVLSIEWSLLVGALLVGAFLLLRFAHAESAYSHDLWWQFAADEQLSRALRLYGAGLVAGLLVLLALALRPARAAAVRAPPFDVDKVAAIVDAQDDPDALFVFTGDKHVLMSGAEDAFIMYAPRGRSLVALGDPIGNPAAFDELIDDFIALGDRHNYRPCFYQVGAEMLTRYIDFGFSLSKLGEAAVVPLASFSLEGPGRKRLRQNHNRAGRDGLAFERLLPPHDESRLDELQAISDEWLATRNTREKSFSLGRFDRDYLQRTEIACVRHEGRLVAFANVLRTASRRAATIDLMRHRGDSPAGTMDFLFVSLMLALKEEGFVEFSLGMAPLVGLGRSRNKRLWDHLGLAIARFGGHFYNFAGLRAFKEKFSPEWRPHYLATWGGVDPLLVAVDVNALVSGGVTGAVLRGNPAKARRGALSSKVPPAPVALDTVR